VNENNFVCSSVVVAGELKGQPANTGSAGKMAVKTEYVCVCAVK